MRKKLSRLFVAAFVIGLIITLSSCEGQVDDDSKTSTCSGVNYKATLYQKDHNSRSSGKITVTVYTAHPDSVQNNFTEDIKVKAFVGKNYNSCVNGGGCDGNWFNWEISAGSKAPFSATTKSSWIGPDDYNVTIYTPHCDGETNQGKDDLDDNFNEYKCDFADQISFEERQCDGDYQFTWAANGADLTGVKYHVYGVEIDLSAATTQTYNVSQLDTSISGGHFSYNGSLTCNVAIEGYECGKTGTISITNQAEVGDDLTVTVEDANLNRFWSAKDTVSILVYTDLGEKDTLLLTETGVNTGIFSAIIKTNDGATAGVNNDGVINVTGGTVVTASYDDVLDEFDADPAAVTVQVTMTAKADPFAAFVDAKLILKSSALITSNGDTLLNNKTQPGSPCYGNYYDVFKSDGTLENYVNNDISDMDCSTSSLNFTQKWVLNGSTMTLSNTDGSYPVEWTLEVVSSTKFVLRSVQGTDTNAWTYIVY